MGLTSGLSPHSSERVEFVEALLFLVFAGRLVARIELGRGSLLLFAVGGGRAGIGAGLYLRGVGHIALTAREEIWNEIRWRIDY